MNYNETREEWKKLLQQAGKCLKVLENYTKKLEYVDELTESEILEINMQCRQARSEMESYLERLHLMAEHSARFFDEDRELARLYNEFHESMRNVHKTTLKVMGILKEKMALLEDKINLLQKKKRAILMYRSHQIFK